MSGLIPFERCVARPMEDDMHNPESILLTGHLTRVSSYMEKWILSHDELGSDSLRVKLYRLAGLCHDLAKCSKGWQEYINDQPKENQGPPHAPAGAFLFSYAAYYLWEKNDGVPDLLIDWWNMIRDLADHHGSLKSRAQDYWRRMVDWDDMDLTGMHAFLVQQVPQLEALTWDKTAFAQWTLNLDDILDEIDEEAFLQCKALPLNEKMRKLHHWRYMTTGLIAADRFDVSPTDCPELDVEQWKACERYVEHFCTGQRHHPLASERACAQQSVMEQLKQHAEDRFYTLEMPTGYGKTVTAFKIAAYLGQRHQSQKMIYVAPYISILEQTSDVIKKAMGRKAIEHHSLAVWDETEANDRPGKAGDDQKTPISQLAIESWAHDMVCTSFQQFARAVFPKRSQDTLRRSFLQKSIILIDEPQIFSPEGWNTFLTGLQGLAEELDLIVVFLSATMPPFDHGLSVVPTQLTYHAAKPVERYQIIKWNESLDEHRLAERLLDREDTHQAAILNTIEDAYLVYRSINSRMDTILVHGLMIPLHKKMVLQKIRHHLSKHRNIPLIVISTQVLEAGVDVSFQHVARALPIMPSIIQAAGRVNRHHERGLGQLSVFEFLRHGEKQTRTSIYTNPDLREITDSLLAEKEIWRESETNGLIKKYYREMFKRNTYTAGQEAISRAIAGDWPMLSQYEPFGADFFRLPLFVPWKCPESDVAFLPSAFKQLQEAFGLSDPSMIYDCYQDKTYWKSKDFAVRKKFMTLFQYYVLNLPVQVALKYAAKEDYLQNLIPALPAECHLDYDGNNGLLRHFSEMENII
ncbi:CRISPR-associated helicase/endonuclease Cas3 [Fischerella thermalis CCMEE 5273]|nr:CRISPR-associated helicase/endonuclease Cas3 [Fischerella thermalis CCMEE 5273]